MQSLHLQKQVRALLNNISLAIARQAQCRHLICIRKYVPYLLTECWTRNIKARQIIREKVTHYRDAFSGGCTPPNPPFPSVAGITRLTRNKRNSSDRGENNYQHKFETETPGPMSSRFPYTSNHCRRFPSQRCFAPYSSWPDLDFRSHTSVGTVGVRSMESESLRQGVSHARGRETLESANTRKLSTRCFLLKRFPRKSQGHVQGGQEYLT